MQSKAEQLKEIKERINAQHFEIYEHLIYGKELKAAFLIEIEQYDQGRWDLPARAARLAAACKRYKTAMIIEFIFDIWNNEIQEGNPIEMSPYFAKDIALAFFKRAGTHTLYVIAFSKKGRTCRNKDHDKIDYITKKYKKSAKNLERKMNAEIESTKSWYSIAKERKENKR